MKEFLAKSGIYHVFPINNVPKCINHCHLASTSIAHFTTFTSRNDDQKRSSASLSTEKTRAIVEKAKSKSKATRSSEQMLKEDERIRQLLLDRDGGSASVPTREGKWDQEMGRETSRQMYRVLDQVRISRPKTSTLAEESESKGGSSRR